MWRVGGEKKGLLARICRKIMEGKKRKKEKKDAGDRPGLLKSSTVEAS